jgi:hypothetical protein
MTMDDLEQIVARHEDLLSAKIAEVEKEVENKRIAFELTLVSHQQMLEDIKVRFVTWCRMIKPGFSSINFDLYPLFC